MSTPIRPSYINPDQSQEVTDGLKQDDMLAALRERRQKRRVVSDEEFMRKRAEAARAARSKDDPEAASFLSSLAGGPIAGLLETAQTLMVDVPRALSLDVPEGTLGPLGGRTYSLFPGVPSKGAVDSAERAIKAAKDKNKQVFGDPAKSGIGVGLLYGVGQFAAGLKVFKAMGLGQIASGITKIDEAGKITKLGRVVKGATQGAAVDFAVFDPEENILAEMGARLPVVGEIFEAIRINPDDPALIKRLKSMLVGMGIGIGTEHVVAGARAMAAKARFRKMLEEGTLRHEDFDPNGLKLATDLAQVRAIYHDAKKVVGVAADIAKMGEEGRLGTFEGTELARGRARVRVSQAAPTDMAMAKPDLEAGTRPGDNPLITESTDVRNKVDGLSDRQRAAIEHAKAEREHLRALKTEVEQAWKDYTETNAYKRLRPDVKRALDRLVNNDAPRVDLVPRDELLSEAGRRAAKEAPAAAGVKRTKQGLQDFINGPLRENLRKWAIEGSLEQKAGEGRLNLHLLGGPEETKTVFNAIRDAIVDAKKGDNIQATSRSFEDEAARTAKLLSMENAEVIQMAARLNADTENAAATIQAMRVLVKGYGDELLSAAVDYDTALRNGFVPPELEARAFALYENAMSAYLITKGATGNIARALSYMRAGAGDFVKSVGLDDLERAKRTVFGGNVGFAKVMKAIATSGSGDLAATYKWLEAIERARDSRPTAVGRAMHELFVSNTLAAARTHTTNFVGNAGWHFVDVLERDILATAIQRGSLSQALKSTVAGYAAGLDGLLYLGKVMAASFRGASADWNLSGNANARAVSRALNNIRRAWKTGETQLLDDGSSIGEIGSYWNADILLDQESSALAKNVVNGIGKYTGTIRSLLATADEMWANLNYFVELRRRAYLRGLDQGLSTKDGSLKKFVQTFEENIDSVEKEEIRKKALEIARRNVFQEQSDLADVLNSIKHKNAALGLVIDYAVPFKRTPINLFKLGIERSPAAPVRDIYRAFRSEDNIARRLFKPGQFKAAAATEEGAEFLARYVMAGALFTGMYFAWKNGLYQGSALSTKERDQIRAQGGLEQAFVFGDSTKKKYVQILRADPIAIPFGIAADIFSIMEHLNEDDDDALHEATQFGVALLMAMQMGFKSRNYLNGITMLLDVINSDSESVGTAIGYYLGQLAGSQVIPNFVPHANVQLFSDGERKDAREYTQSGRIDALATAVNQFKARLGFDGELPPRRTLFGPTMMPEGFFTPFPTSSPGKATPAADEFRRLDLPVDLSAWLKDVDGVVLKPGDRAKLGEDFESVRLNGFTVVEALDKAVQTSQYQKMHDEAKIKHLTKIVERYKTAAERAFERRPGMAEILRAGRLYRKLSQLKGKDEARADSRVSKLLEYYQ